MTRAIIAASILCATLRAEAPLSAEEIVRRSVEANQHDWKVASSFAFQEREVEKKDGQVTDRTYEVITIDGTPYRRLIAIDGKPLPPARQKLEIQKERHELARRRAETPDERQDRIQKYQKERDRDNLLMNQMAVALTFKLNGEENVGGRPAWVLSAEPKPDYKPINRDAKVLTGMRGKLWIEKGHFHWAKVEAEVIHTVTFGGFLAHVDPGTSFMLEKEPVDSDTWQPTRFEVHVQASVLLWNRASVTTDSFRDYQHRMLSSIEPGAASPLQIELETQKIKQVPEGNDGEQPVAIDDQKARQSGVSHFR